MGRQLLARPLNLVCDHPVNVIEQPRMGDGTGKVGAVLVPVRSMHESHLIAQGSPHCDFDPFQCVEDDQAQLAIEDIEA